MRGLGEPFDDAVEAALELVGVLLACRLAEPPAAGVQKAHVVCGKRSVQLARRLAWVCDVAFVHTRVVA